MKSRYPQNSDPRQTTALRSVGDAISQLSVALEQLVPDVQPLDDDVRDKRDKAFQACVEEYKAIRGEQVKRLEVADRNLNYVAIIIAATLGGAISLFRNDQGSGSVAMTILLVPPLATPFIFTMVNNELMIIRLGVYCYDKLRPLVLALTNEAELWDWERYHVVQSKALMFRVSSSLRRAIYILPSLAPPIIFLLLRHRPFSNLETTMLVVDFALGAFTVLLLLYYRSAFAKAVSLKGLTN